MKWYWWVAVVFIILIYLGRRKCPQCRKTSPIKKSREVTSEWFEHETKTGKADKRYKKNPLHQVIETTWECKKCGHPWQTSEKKKKNGGEKGESKTKKVSRKETVNSNRDEKYGKAAAILSTMFYVTCSDNRFAQKEKTFIQTYLFKKGILMREEELVKISLKWRKRDDEEVFKEIEKYLDIHEIKDAAEIARVAASVDGFGRKEKKAYIKLLNRFDICDTIKIDLITKLVNLLEQRKRML